MKLTIAKPSAAAKPVQKKETKPAAPKGRRRSEKDLGLWWLREELLKIKEQSTKLEKLDADDGLILACAERPLKPAHYETIGRHARGRIDRFMPAIETLLKKHGIL